MTGGDEPIADAGSAENRGVQFLAIAKPQCWSSGAVCIVVSFRVKEADPSIAARSDAFHINRRWSSRERELPRLSVRPAGIPPTVRTT